MRIIAGRARGRRLEAPRDQATRPTSDRAREALFSILSHGHPNLTGTRFLDLFAGTGAVGLEAWSRGAAAVVMVEHDRQAVVTIRRNIATLGAADAIVVQGDATRLGAPPGGPFDIVFMDPPYHAGVASAVLTGLRARSWLAPAARLVIELAAREALDAPPGFRVLDERRYGAGRFVFVAMQEEADAASASG